MSCSANPAITGVCCMFKSVKLLFTEPNCKSETSLLSQFSVTNLKDNSVFWQSFHIEAFLRANIFIFNCMQSVCVEKQLCSTYCVFNNSQPIYSLRGRHMHGCFYWFLFVNCLCSKDNDLDRFYMSKYSGKYKLVVNEIDLVKNIFSR